MGLAVKKVSSRRQEPHRAATQKKTRPALSKEYQAVFENTGKAMVIVEENATISLANAEFEKLSGYTKKEIEGIKRWTEFVSRDDRKRVGEYHLLRRSDPMLAPRSFAFRFLDRQEQVKNVVLTIGTIPGTNKSMASLLDVTDRRQAEIAQKNSKGQEGGVKVHVMELKKANKALQAEVAGLKREVHRLQQSEKRYQTLMENIDFGINLIDADYNIVMVNNAFTKRRKTSANNLIGKKCFRAFEKRDTVCPHCPGVRAMAAGKPAVVETVGAEDGLNRFPSRLQAFPIVQEDGTASGFIEVVEDITERRRAEEVLRQSEEWFKMLADNAPFGISIMATDRHFEYFNPRFTAIFGYTIEDTPDKDTWFSKAYPDDTYRKEVSAVWKTDLEEDVKLGEENPRVFTVRCKNGPEKRIDFRTVYLDDGKQYLFYEDVTDRAEAEEKLRQSEDRYRTLIETMKVGLSAIDENGVITYVNDQSCKMLGYSMNEIIGHPTVDFYDEESRKRQEENFAKRRKGSKDPSPYEVTWVTKDGRKVHTILTPTPSFDAGGQFTGSFAIFTDITERKHMEEALQKSEALHRTLIETTKVGVSAIKESGVIIYVNERLCDIWGYALNEIMGHRVTEFLDEENLKILQEQLAKRRGGGRDPYEIAWRRKDGKNVSTILAPTPIFDADGHYKGSYGFITDITERMQIEERLQRYAADLERINEEVKNFAYIVSHDLRVPLVNLKGYSAELRTALGVVGANFDAVLPHLAEEKQSEVAMALHEDVPEALKFITTSVSQMDSFINAVLTLSRLGRQDLKPESIDMNTLVRTTMENMSHQIHEREIDVTVGSLPEVVADRTSMEQIMGNILGNAVKYLDPERPGQIKVNAEINNGEQFFRIQDNGRGIAQQDMHKVFTPFRRAGKQDTPGEGMGLAYVQTLVRRHGGRIWCESELGKGTTLTFTIATPSEQRVPDA